MDPTAVARVMTLLYDVIYADGELFITLDTKEGKHAETKSTHLCIIQVTTSKNRFSIAQNFKGACVFHALRY